MKQCTSCGQILSQKISTCPACGSKIIDGIRQIDDYRILKIIHEGRSSLVCQATKKYDDKPVSIRLFTPKSGVDEAVAVRLKNELEELNKLPADHFVQHYAIKKSSGGLWYRVSEWVNAYDWGSIFMSDMLHDKRKVVTLFHNIASVLHLLNQQDHFMPYLILDDILIPRDKFDGLHVKINYKLSRFLNARATHHGPMLQKLLDCHPDIKNRRAIDFKSGIWSLGKLFVEILTADPNLKDFSSKVDELTDIPRDLAKLLKIMLSDDPDLRPQSMARVAQALSRILDKMPYAKNGKTRDQDRPKLIKEIQRFKRLVVSLIILIGVIVAGAGISWFYSSQTPQDQTIAQSRIIEAYAESVAFMMVEYGLYGEKKAIYKNKVEGTAFLVDKAGYFLTNRHVACPWLDDAALFQFYGQAKLLQRPVKFKYRMFLWFEGKKAFNRSPALSSSTEISDVYFLSSAQSSESDANLRIVGVPRSSMKTGERIKSPFKNDFAVLKIDTPLPDMTPLPLASDLPSENIQRLSQVYILGFPLGNITQGDFVNASITSGHVRRSTKELIQVDSSIYKGNSGGPAINAQGKVIGIASGVITDYSSGYFKVKTPLSDFGLILPIHRPASLIASIKKGHPHWNGVLDFDIETKIAQITALAVENEYEQAARLCDTMLETSDDPTLIFAAGMMHFCSRHFEKSRHLLKKLALIESENTTARLMLYVIDWIKQMKSPPAITRPLLKMAWHESDEFLGYLARVLETGKRMDPEFLEYENRTEKSWRLFIEGLLAERANELDIAQTVFKESILSAGTSDWLYFLSYSRLIHIQKQLKSYLENRDKIEKNMAAFHSQAKTQRESTSQKTTEVTALVRQLDSQTNTVQDTLEIYEQLLQIAPDNRTIMGRLAFFHATQGQWQQAIDYIDQYFQKDIRETALSLSLSLLRGQILNIMDKPEAAETHLRAFIETSGVSWYNLITRHILSGSIDDQKIIKLAGSEPEKLITIHTALGLRAEGSNNRNKAAYHYREALSTYLDGWNEYDLALGRIMKFKETPE